mmetsp:Transcript_3344/g.8011  ORF Transcript_3344/g.8011 Transcript_3344/m.8011 type:complete len:322 (+) Transcript_3344:145-1110(+)
MEDELASCFTWASGVTSTLADGAFAHAAPSSSNAARPAPSTAELPEPKPRSKKARGADAPASNSTSNEQRLAHMMLMRMQQPHHEKRHERVAPPSQDGRASHGALQHGRRELREQDPSCKRNAAGELKAASSYNRQPPNPNDSFGDAAGRTHHPISRMSESNNGVADLVEQFVTNRQRRQETIDAHLEEVEDMLEQGDPIKFAFWTLDQDSSFYKNSGDAPRMLDELGHAIGLTKDQAVKLNAHRAAIRQNRETLSRCLEHLRHAREEIEKHVTDSSAITEELRKVLEPVQVAKFFVWVEQNQGKLQMSMDQEGCSSDQYE